MFKPGQIVLVDTMVIVEAHRVGCWPSLGHFFALHTVEKVIEETQTGYQNRRPEQEVNPRALRDSFREIIAVDAVARASFALAYPGSLLDPGERDLAIYAESLDPEEIWWLNSPDHATLRHAHSRGWLDRLVSLEAMCHRLGQSPKIRENFSERWLGQAKVRLLT